VSRDRRTGRSRFRSLAVRYIGPAPPKGAPELQKLRWTRGVGLKVAVPFIPVLVIAAIAIDQLWAYVVLGVWAVLWLGSLLGLSRDISRRERGG
jgi:hypothetical protein